jgi:hypothetical protein
MTKAEKKKSARNTVAAKRAHTCTDCFALNCYRRDKKAPSFCLTDAAGTSEIESTTALYAGDESGGQIAPAFKSTARRWRNSILNEAKAAARRCEHSKGLCLTQVIIDKQTLSGGDRDVGTRTRRGRADQLGGRAQGGKRGVCGAFVEQAASIGPAPRAVLHERQVSARLCPNAGNQGRFRRWQAGEWSARCGDERHAVEHMRTSALHFGGNVRDLRVVDARDENGIHLDQDSGSAQSRQRSQLSLQEHGRAGLAAQHTLAVADPGVDARTSGRIECVDGDGQVAQVQSL